MTCPAVAPGATGKLPNRLPDSCPFPHPDVCLPQCGQGQTSRRRERDHEHFLALCQVGNGATFSGQPATLSPGHPRVHPTHSPSSPGARGSHAWFQREPPMPTPAGPAPPCERQGGHPAAPALPARSILGPRGSQPPSTVLKLCPSCLPAFFLHHVFESTLKILHQHIN